MLVRALINLGILLTVGTAVGVCGNLLGVGIVPTIAFSGLVGALLGKVLNPCGKR